MPEKSALYPRVSWEECMEFVKTVSSFSLKAVSYTEVAKKYGISNPAAKSFTAKLSACKQYGLLNTIAGNTIQLTDTCKRLLFPTGEDLRAVKKACFGLPPLYNKLIALYDGKALPGKDALANILMKDHKIQQSVKDNAAKMFLDSAEQLGLIRGGILCYADPDEPTAEAPLTENAPEAAAPGMSAGLTVAGEIRKPYASGVRSENESDYITQAIPFESGKIARFSIPVDACEDDLLLLNDMFQIILKRKFKFEP